MRAPGSAPTTKEQAQAQAQALARAFNLNAAACRVVALFATRCLLCLATARLRALVAVFKAGGDAVGAGAATGITVCISGCAGACCSASTVWAEANCE